MPVLIVWAWMSLIMRAVTYLFVLILLVILAPIRLLGRLLSSPTARRRGRRPTDWRRLGRQVGRALRQVDEIRGRENTPPHPSPPAMAPRLDHRPATARDAYLEMADELFQTWMDGRPMGGPSVRRFFQVDHAPEPYLLFGEEPRLTFLSTNPGGALPFQRHPAVETDSVFTPGQTYDDAARRLGRLYGGPLGPINGSARSKNIGMSRIAALLGYRGVMQVEALPWHSQKLPKDLIAGFETDDPIARSYLQALEDFLAKQPIVLSFSAGTPALRGGQGVDLKARLIGLDLQTATMTPLLSSRTGVSQALFWSRDDARVRGLFVNQGSDVLPAARTSTDAAIRQALTRRA